MKYVMSILAVLLLAICSVLIVTSIFDSKSKSTVSKKATTQFSLIDYIDKDSAVSVTTGGPIVGEDQYKSIRVTISKQVRTVDVLVGYEMSVQKTTSLANTPAAYDVFLRSLNRAGFANAKTASVNDERGLCPLGSRYSYELKEGSKSVFRTWATTCGRFFTFNGNGPLVQTLFQAQITDYSRHIISTSS